VRELAARQADLEAAAPLLRSRLEELRGQLSDLRLSDAAAAELRLLPGEARTPLDEVGGGWGWGDAPWGGRGWREATGQQGMHMGAIVRRAGVGGAGRGAVMLLEPG
jgi:hypothetical protein